MNVNLLGIKLGMTQLFSKKGDIIPVTIIKSGPCFITQIKTIALCGYNSIQVGYLELSPDSKLLTKPLLGHFLKNSLLPYKHLKEFCVKNPDSYFIGQRFSIENLILGENLTISGFTIGKGNTGNIKQHHFSRGPMGHGSKHKRLQGSLGAGTTPGRTFPGKKMPRRAGFEKCTIKGLLIVGIDLTHNLIAIKGCIPGKSGNLLNITQ